MMPIIMWDEKYSVGIGAMDDQHKKLVDLINLLHDAMKAGKASMEISLILKGLSDYTVFHFSDEEKLMRENNYPELVNQQQRHREFVNKLMEFQQESATASGILTSMKVQEFLRDWLVGHIRGEDQKYMKFLNDRGIH